MYVFWTTNWFTYGNQKIMSMFVDWRKRFQKDVSIRSNPQWPRHVVWFKLQVPIIFGSVFIFTLPFTFNFNVVLCSFWHTLSFISIPDSFIISTLIFKIFSFFTSKFFFRPFVTITIFFVVFTAATSHFKRKKKHCLKV